MYFTFAVEKRCDEKHLINMGRRLSICETFELNDYALSYRRFDTVVL